MSDNGEKEIECQGGCGKIKKTKYHWTCEECQERVRKMQWRHDYRVPGLNLRDFESNDYD